MIFFSPILEMVIICQSCKKSKTFPFFCHISFWTESHCGSQLLHPFQCPRSKAPSCHLSSSSFWAESVLMGQPSQYLKHGSPISFKRHLIIHNGEKPNKWNQPRSKALSFHLSNSSFWSKSVLVAPRGGLAIPISETRLSHLFEETFDNAQWRKAKQMKSVKVKSTFLSSIQLLLIRICFGSAKRWATPAIPISETRLSHLASSWVRAKERKAAGHSGFSHLSLLISAGSIVSGITPILLLRLNTTTKSSGQLG